MRHQLRKSLSVLTHADPDEKTALCKHHRKIFGFGDERVTVGGGLFQIDENLVLRRQMPDDLAGIRQYGILMRHGLQNIRFDFQIFRFPEKKSRHHQGDGKDNGPSYLIFAKEGHEHL